MADQWWLSLDGTEHGPGSEQQAQQMVRQHPRGREMFAFRDGDPGGWRPVVEVWPNLFSTRPPPPRGPAPAQPQGGGVAVQRVLAGVVVGLVGAILGHVIGARQHFIPLDPFSIEVLQRGFTFGWIVGGAAVGAIVGALLKPVSLGTRGGRVSLAVMCGLLVVLVVLGVLAIQEEAPPLVEKETIPMPVVEVGDGGEKERDEDRDYLDEEDQDDDESTVDDADDEPVLERDDGCEAECDREHEQCAGETDVDCILDPNLPKCRETRSAKCDREREVCRAACGE